MGTAKKKTLTSLFPLAKMDGVIPEHAKSFEAQQTQQDELNPSQSPPPYEKVFSIVTHVQVNQACIIVLIPLSSC